MNRKGSALLIVLGMMAFMVVSAVAFSAYMRYSRLPSSYLRRTSSSRQLVKAALAEAIDAVDRAILNNPHPGVGSQSYSGGNKNIWYGRVLCATNELVEARETVSVLSLEGLAYVPPALVNEVRYYSRRTPTAIWENFWYDSGRYAFCAVDVSDYFDVNRMFASKPRSSAANRRISLSYLFENADHTSQGQDPSPWDNTFMDKFRDVDEETEELDYTSKCPLVSLADFNLALGESGVCGMLSPFARYFSGGGTAGFYGSDSQDESELFRRMTFVTDSLEAEEKRDTSEDAYTGEKLDLSGDGQPFDFDAISGGGGPRGGNGPSFGKIDQASGKGAQRLKQIMPLLGRIALYDYLDEDRVPVSLACPSVERSPMCCGISANFNGISLSVKKNEGNACTDQACQSEVAAQTWEQAGLNRVYAKVDYYIDPKLVQELAKAEVKALFVYPFAHGEGVPVGGYSVDGTATLFFSRVDNPVKLRTNDAKNQNNVLRFTGDDSIKGLTTDGRIVMPLAGNYSSPSKSVASQEDVLSDVTFRKFMIEGEKFNDIPLLTVTYGWDPVWVPPKDEAPGYYRYKTLGAALGVENHAQAVDAFCGIPPIGPDGLVDPAFKNSQSLLDLVKNGVDLAMNLAVTVRIKNSDGDTVDLAPAHSVDDLLNNVDHTKGGGPRGDQASNFICGSGYPLLKFPTGIKFNFSRSAIENLASTPVAMDLNRSIAIVDPRYNYAPESWHISSGISKQDWLAAAKARGADDIFMATSDQGYMQSVYELAFIPAFSDLGRVGSSSVCGDYYTSFDGIVRDDIAGAPADAVNANMMWSCYQLFGNDRDDFENTGFVAGGRGVKVNPYSDSTNILMAAFANTPISWRLASTNNSEVSGLEPGGSMTSKEFNDKYAWNDFSGGEASIAWEDLEAVASRFRNQVRSEQNWKSAWDQLWRNENYDSNCLCGEELVGDGSPLWSVDKKFFYGFWRECFAARQQLFLIFVRAEPMMMGGEGIGQTPPQLGARAVALVWRDPNAVTSSNDEGINGYPHRTRVLFYRQLD